MMINRTNNRNYVQTICPKSENARLSSSFGELLNQSTSKDSFSMESVSKPTTSSVGLSSVPITQAKLDKISEAIRNSDYSEMSKAEIYADIEKKYADAFDDFYATLAFPACKEHDMIHDQFVNDVDNHVGYLKNGIVREARGYSNMTFNEIEAVIKEKYAGKTDFMNQLNLFGELFSSGVLSNKYGREEACNIVSKLSLSVECGGDGIISKDEWLKRIAQTGASSPFMLLLNNPYLSKYREMFQAMVNDILFGI